MNRILLSLKNYGLRNGDRLYYDKLIVENLVVKDCVAVDKTFKLVLDLPLQESWRNSLGTLHGGAISTIIDQSTTLAIAGLDDRNSVSIDLSISFIAAVKVSSSIQIEAICHKIGKSLAFTTAEIRNGTDIIATGKHTKFMLSTKWTD
jgi:uncharacterized protein (TIGR00369 family)